LDGRGSIGLYINRTPRLRARNNDDLGRNRRPPPPSHDDDDDRNEHTHTHTHPTIRPDDDESVVLVREWTGQHFLDECFVVDHAFAVLDTLRDFIYLVLIEAFAEREQNVPKFGG